jgi:hypothetical protein
VAPTIATRQLPRSGFVQLRLCGAPHKRKVTNGFRSEWGAKTYAALCSIVETGRRNSRNALTAIRDALALPAAQAAAPRPAHTG